MATVVWNTAVVYSYYRGLGVPQDYSAAADWFRKAAELGHAGAQNSLGYSYYYGEGISQDYVEAVTLVPQSSRTGSWPGHKSSRQCVLPWRGSLHGYTQRQFGYRKAADQGEAVAEHSMGFLFEHGRVSLKTPMSRTWYRQSGWSWQKSARNSSLVCSSMSRSGSYDTWRR